jgi:hypothetical protein
MRSLLDALLDASLDALLDALRRVFRRGAPVRQQPSEEQKRGGTSQERFTTCPLCAGRARSWPPSLSRAHSVMAGASSPRRRLPRTPTPRPEGSYPGSNSARPVAAPATLSPATWRSARCVTGPATYRSKRWRCRHAPIARGNLGDKPVYRRETRPWCQPTSPPASACFSVLAGVRVTFSMTPETTRRETIAVMRQVQVARKPRHMMVVLPLSR